MTATRTSGQLHGAVAVLLLGLVGACARPGVAPPPVADAAVPAATVPSPSAKAPDTSTSKSAVKTGALTAPVPPPAPRPPGEAELSAGRSAAEELKTEEPEANPYSESVTLKVAVTPPVKALVMWGAKQMAKLAPGSMDAEIVRPRGSGPLDLEIKADGYLPYHTRLYTDRDEKANVRLYRIEDAPGLFGYGRSSHQTTIPTEKKR